MSTNELTVRVHCPKFPVMIAHAQACFLLFLHATCREPDPPGYQYKHHMYQDRSMVISFDEFSTSVPYAWRILA